ncbi:putative methyltransferase-domain-containing protein [Delphinella strobiligena]|nr:putative methyltransferase-domain-containing protein [Delphinella strobiligena]
MHYLRFLKTPKVTVKDGSVILSAVVTVTTDLGETFYLNDVALAILLRAPEQEGDIYLRRTFQWTAGMRSLPITLDITRNDIDWPARLHIGVKGGHMSDHFEYHHNSDALPGIISVWSESLNPIKGKFETRKRVERRFTPLTQRSLNIYEDTGESIARHLWDGSLALTAYIDRVIGLEPLQTVPALESVLASAAFKKLNVLELGCGCGIVGIGMAQTIPDCDVLLTDLPEVDELVEQNISIAKPAMSSNIQFCPLDWEAPLPTKVRSRIFDLIIVAECIYNSDSIPPLVETLSALVQRSPKAVILISTKVRHSSEAMFWDLFEKRGFTQFGKAALSLSGEPGHGYGDSATQVDLYVYHGKDFRSSTSPDSRSENKTYGW